jgi:glycosyltransferase involved in cell wall biosynthesis
MATGLACITTDSGGCVEILDDTGFIIPVTKITEDLPKQLKRLIANKRLTASLGARARQRVIKEYNQERNFTQLIKTFTSTINLYH